MYLGTIITCFSHDMSTIGPSVNNHACQSPGHSYIIPFDTLHPQDVTLSPTTIHQ